MLISAPLPAKPAAGRPRDEAKLKAIVSAARDAFFERGFGAATIEDIAARAGVSKVTVYSRFGDKETLFESVVQHESARKYEPLDVAADSFETLTEQLNLFGVGLLKFLLHPSHLALDRMLAQEFVAMPELARRFFAAGPGHCRTRLAEVLAAAHERRLIEVDDAPTAAEQLLVLWKGFTDMELKFGMVPAVGEERIRAQVVRGTGLFLKAYRTDAD